MKTSFPQRRKDAKRKPGATQMFLLAFFAPLRLCAFAGDFKRKKDSFSKC